MGKRVHSDATRAACMAALLTGQSISSVAREYKIPKGTVSRWNRQVPVDASAHTDGSPVMRTQKEREPIGDKLIGYLHAALETLRKQAVVFGDEEWLKKQPANELAILHGVLADKTIRLLEALSTSAQGETDATPLDAQPRAADGGPPH